MGLIGSKCWSGLRLRSECIYPRNADEQYRSAIGDGACGFLGAGKTTLLSRSARKQDVQASRFQVDPVPVCFGA